MSNENKSKQTENLDRREGTHVSIDTEAAGGGFLDLLPVFHLRRCAVSIYNYDILKQMLLFSQQKFYS